MSDDKTEVSYKVRLASCRTVQFHENPMPDEDPDIHELMFSTNYGFAVDDDNKGVSVWVSIEYATSPEVAEKNTLVKIETRSVYEFDDLIKIATIDEDTIDMPRNVLASILGISISTTRGMLLVLAQSEFIRSNPFPILNPVDLLNRADN